MFELGPMQKQWIAALRDGEYIQNEDGGMMCVEMETGPEYCCLGVAVKLFGLDADHCLLSNMSWFKLGLRSRHGDLKEVFFKNKLPFSSLVQMNDGLSFVEGERTRFSFSEIADYIEQNPENVFTHSV